LSNNKVFIIDEEILLFFKAQILANSRRLFAKFATRKNGKRTSQNDLVYYLSFLSPIRMKRRIKPRYEIGEALFD
jgi:hypothetical protein